MLAFLGQTSAAGLIVQIARNASRFYSPAATLCGQRVAVRGGLGPRAARLVVCASFTVVIIRNVFLTAACCRSMLAEV